MKKAAILSSLIMFCAVLSYGQSYVFSTLVSKGQNKYLNGSSWASIKPGAKIGKTSKISVAQGGYLALMHSSGRTYEVKTSGMYEVSKLEARLSQGTSSFTQKYGKFVANNMVEGEGKFADYSTTGSVTRGDQGVISILGPTADAKVSVLEEQVFTLRWATNKKVTTYNVKIKNLYEDVLIEKEVTKPEIEINLKEWDVIAGDQPYLLIVSDKDNQEDVNSKNYEGKDMPFYVVGGGDAISKEYKTLMKEINESSALDNLVLAAFFDQNGLKLNAVDCFVKAMTLEPEIEYYKEVYQDYLKANKLEPQLVESFDDLDTSTEE
jgi:hypothetical protein